jgi:hypothetical protein
MASLVDLRTDCLIRGAEIKFVDIPEPAKQFLLVHGVRLNPSPDTIHAFALVRHPKSASRRAEVVG